MAPYSCTGYGLPTTGHVFSPQRKLCEGAPLAGGAGGTCQHLAHNLVANATRIIAVLQLAVLNIRVGFRATWIRAGAGLDRDADGLGLRWRTGCAEVAAEHEETAGDGAPELAEVSGGYRVTLRRQRPQENTHHRVVGMRRYGRVSIGLTGRRKCGGWGSAALGQAQGLGHRSQPMRGAGSRTPRGLMSRT